MTFRRSALLTASVVAIMALAACSNTAESTTTTTTEGTNTTAGGVSAEVTIAGFAFSPSTLTVPVGTTVTWTNSDGTTHTVTADGGAFDSGNLADGTTFQFTFTEAGAFPYHCSLHSSMQGTITVTG